MDVESSSACFGMEELGLLNPKIAAPPCRKVKIIIKLKKTIEEEEVVPAGPPATSSSSSSENNSSMKLKLEATKRKLEQRYSDEAEKKAKKKIQRINIHDDFPNPNNHNLAGGGPGLHGEVRERLLAKLRRMKKKNQKPKYCLYSKPEF